MGQSLMEGNRQREAMIARDLVAFKRCTHCGEMKPLDGFHERKASADGHQSWCRDCVRANDAGRAKKPKARAAKGAAKQPIWSNDLEQIGYVARYKSKTVVHVEMYGATVHVEAPRR